MDCQQVSIQLPAHSRGCHVITNHILKHISALSSKFSCGTCHLFLKHTSAALALCESWDAGVTVDMQYFLEKIIPFDPKFTHTLEGEDDMTAHIKSTLVGVDVTIPISNGNLNLGTWQGIWLVEGRDALHKRTVVATIMGKLKTCHKSDSDSSATISSSK